MGIGAAGAAAVAASAVGSVASSAISASGAKSAAKTQTNAANSAAANLSAAGAGAQNYLNPYVAGGSSAYGNLLSNPSYTDNAASQGYLNQAQGENNQADGILTALGNGSGLTQSTIENTPGWAAINALGQQGVTNSAAARGLGNSGAAVKGAADYATTMANNTYQNLYQDQLGTAGALGSSANNFLNEANTYQSGLNSEFTRGNQLAQYGLTASADSANNALTAAGASNSAAMTGANAAAAGTVGSANALASGITGATNAYSTYSLYNQLLNGGGGNNSATLSSGASDVDPNFGNGGSNFGSAGSKTGF